MIPTQEPVPRERAKQINPIVLAFVGDAVYTLCVRTRLALSSGEKTGALNRRASERVSAHGQSEALARILPMLTEEEAEIYRRGRNAKKPTKSKNATVAEYVRSTGFEALLGYLYLTGQTERIRQLFFSEDDEI
ncbi:MAG TPA: ribonuclease III [Firmicutes bacterium]|nr:ribonuclease III [Bacillota bacterium]